MVAGTNLRTEPSEQLQRKIINRFWRKEEAEIKTEEYVSYFLHYNSTCRALFLGAIRRESLAIALQTHEDLLDVVDKIWFLADANRNFRRPDLRASLVQLDCLAQQPQFKIDNSVSLVLRLWLTIRVQETDFNPAGKAIQWDDTSTFSDFINMHFPGPRLRGPSGSGSLLESTFTAVNLYRMCGIRIEWISHLEDHLTFDIERRALMVYSLAGCLQDHVDGRTILPTALVRETLLSLSILFPNWDLRTERFLRNSQNTQLYEYPFEYPCHAHLNEFWHWRDRLARIHHEFQSPGPGWRQLWSDRRNPLQWYTFWFAVAILILTLAFGISTTILASLQTLYTYQGLQLARAAAATPERSPP